MSKRGTAVCDAAVSSLEAADAQVACLVLTGRGAEACKAARRG